MVMPYNPAAMPAIPSPSRGGLSGLQYQQLSRALMGLGSGLLAGRGWGEGFGLGLAGAQRGLDEGQQLARYDEEEKRRANLAGLLASNYKPATGQPALTAELAASLPNETLASLASAMFAPDKTDKPDLLKLTGPGGIDFSVDPSTGLTSLFQPGMGQVPLSSLPSMGDQPATGPQSPYETKLAGFESAGGTDTTNPLNANVEGPYQIDKRYWPEGTTIDDVLASNAAAFQQRYGREPNDWEQYGMHRLGATGYGKLLRAAPDTPAINVLGDAVVGDNPDLVGKTVGEVRSLFKQRFGDDKTWKELGDAGKQSLDWATFQTPRQAAQTNPVEIANTMRGEFTKLTKDFRDTSVAYQKVENAAKNPSAAGDISLVFAYMKLLDPGSVVKESEFATAQNAAGVPQQITNIYNRLLSGERLAPEQRADFTAQAKNVFSVYQRQYDSLKSQYAALAAANGIDPQNIIIEGGVPDASEIVLKFDSQGNMVP